MFDNNIEGFNTCQKMWYTFWNPSMECFSTQQPCHESRGHQFSCYAQAVALHAISDSLKVYKDMTLPIVDPVIRSCLKYRSAKRGAYSVECCTNKINGGDDEDICYDDNEHLLRALIEIYKVTKDPTHLDLCKEIMQFILNGLVEHEIWHVKSLKWHFTKPYMAAISGSVGSICAMEMIQFTDNDQDKKSLYDLAKTCVSFIWNRLRDPEDDIIMDGVGYEYEAIDTHKWTYNQGATISALCLLYKYDHDPKWKEMAIRLTDSAVSPGKTLFDRDYPDDEKRFWYDPSYFVQLLVHGIVDFLETFPTDSEVSEDLTNRCRTQILRHLSYLRKYLYDPNDGLYYMTFAINKINRDVYKRFREEFGGTKDYQPEPKERVGGMDNTPVDERPLAKSLIGAGAAAHMFFTGARIFPKMEPSCP